MIKKILLSSIIFISFGCGKISARIPKQGQCFFNRVSKENFLTIKNMENQIIVVGYEVNKIRGFAPITKENLLDERYYKLKPEACPMFSYVTDTVVEVVTAFGLKDDFIKAICLSRSINRWRNREQCERDTGDK